MKQFTSILALLLSLGGCVSPPKHAALAADGPAFSPQAFFTGRSTGEGTLKVIFSGSVQTHVISQGHVEPNGTLVLVQSIKEGKKPLRIRTWRIEPQGDNHFTGTLTDAKGLISATVQGNLLHIRFTTTGGLDTEQWLYLQPCKKVALNRMVVRKYGIPIASLNETITRSE